jgi:CRISPR-associated protein Csm5
MTPLILHAVAIGPIHVGDGTEMTPEAYRLDRDHLVQFDPAAAVAALDPAGQKAFALAVNAGQLHRAQELLHRVAIGGLELARIPVAPDSLDEIRQALTNTARSGRVHPFVRSAGAPYLPGSSVKGAIRTAILSARARSMIRELDAMIEQSGPQPGKTGHQSTRVQEQVFELGSGSRKTDRDPFRFLSVGDASLPAGSTCIERVWNRKLGGALNAMQMHHEAIRRGTRFTLAIAIDHARATSAARRDPDKVARQPIVAPELRRDVDGFYRRIWEAERARFYAGIDLPALPQAGEALLLRVGRFSHFESASVEGLRRGYRPRWRDQKTAEMGSTRMVAKRGDRVMPFGWLALFDDPGKADAYGGPLDTPDPINAAPAAPGARAARRSSGGGRRGTVDGEAVEVLADDGPTLYVRFLDSGDTDSVPRAAFEADQ